MVCVCATGSVITYSTVALDDTPVAVKSAQITLTKEIARNEEAVKLAGKGVVSQFVGLVSFWSYQQSL